MILFYYVAPLYLIVSEMPHVHAVSSILFVYVQAYGRDLAEAYEWCKKYRYTNNVKDLTQAWELYYHVFRRISKQLPQVHVYTSK